MWTKLDTADGQREVAAVYAGALWPTVLFMGIVGGSLLGWEQYRGEVPVVGATLLATTLLWFVTTRWGLALLHRQSGRRAAIPLLLQGQVFLWWLAAVGLAIWNASELAAVVLLSIVGIGMAFNSAAHTDRPEPSAPSSFLGFAAFGSLLAATVGYLHGGWAAAVAEPVQRFAAVVTVIGLAMVLIYWMHATTIEELRRIAAESKQRELALHLADERQAAARRTASLLGTGAGVGIFTHDLASPLHALRANVDFLAEDPDSLDDDLLTDLREVTERIEELSDDLVRALSGTAVPRSTRAICREVDRRLQTMGRFPRGLLEVDCDDAMVVVDPLFTQVLANLVSNGFRYGEGRPVHLVARIDGEKVAWTVRDHGTSGAARHAALERIRTALHSGTSLPPSDAEGSRGLGLWLVSAALTASELEATVSIPDDGGAGVVLCVLTPMDESDAPTGTDMSLAL